jgi:hypothetical protein
MKFRFFLLIFLLNLFGYSYATDLPIKAHKSYIVNNSDYPITVKYKSCLQSFRPNKNAHGFICDKFENTIEIAGNTAKYIGDYEYPNSNISDLRDGKWYLVTQISNNVRTKNYLDYMENIDSKLPSCLFMDRADIDDYDTTDLFCVSLSHSGVRS